MCVRREPGTADGGNQRCSGEPINRLRSVKLPEAREPGHLSHGRCRMSDSTAKRAEASRVLMACVCACVRVCVCVCACTGKRCLSS